MAKIRHGLTATAAPKSPIEMLVESALEFLTRGSKDISEHPKYSIINFATGIELMLKARLMKEHWSLVLEKPGDTLQKDFLEGRAKTVTPKDAMRRLRNVCNEPVPEEAQRAFDGIAEHRNKVMHFFHEAASGNASPALLEQVTKEQCLCWYFLERLLAGWGEPFSAYPGDMWRIRNAMKQNRTYLQAVYDREKPDIEKEEQAGAKFNDCGGCGFHAAKAEDVDDITVEQTCRVCGLVEQYVTIPCPTACGGSVRMLADHGGHRECPKCQHQVTRDEISDAIDTESIDSGMHASSRNCAFCGEHGGVVEHHDRYICTECLQSTDEIAECEWCGEGQIGGGDLTDSHYTGCEFCDGKGGWPVILSTTLA